MFFRKKNNDERSEKKKILDKVVMGAVIGGAIGSVIGASIAPKKGKETREELIDAAREVKKRSGKFFGKIRQLWSDRKKDTENDLKKIPHENENE